VTVTFDDMNMFAADVSLIRRPPVSKKEVSLWNPPESSINLAPGAVPHLVHHSHVNQNAYLVKADARFSHGRDLRLFERSSNRPLGICPATYFPRETFLIGNDFRRAYTRKMREDIKRQTTRSDAMPALQRHSLARDGDYSAQRCLSSTVRLYYLSPPVVWLDERIVTLCLNSSPWHRV
jgi:hypothetical protein